MDQNYNYKVLDPVQEEGNLQIQPIPNLQYFSDPQRQQQNQNNNFQYQNAQSSYQPNHHMIDNNINSKNNIQFFAHQQQLAQDFQTSIMIMINNISQCNALQDILSSIHQEIKKAKKSVQQQLFEPLFFKTIKLLNEEANLLLGNEDQERTDHILNFCENITFSNEYSNNLSLKALILNSWGCYYRRDGEDSKALEAFKQSLKFIQASQSEHFKGVIFLNLGALLSQRGDHQEALDCSRSAAYYLNKEYLDFMTQVGQFNGESSPQINPQMRKNKSFIELVSNLAISLYNVGSEEEHFSHKSRALLNYQNACIIAENNLGSQNLLAQKLSSFFAEKKNEFSNIQQQKQRNVQSNFQNSRQIGNKSLKNRPLMHSQSGGIQVRPLSSLVKSNQKSHALQQNAANQKLQQANVQQRQQKQPRLRQMSSQRKMQLQIQNQHPEFEEKLMEYVQQRETKRIQLQLQHQFPFRFSENPSFFQNQSKTQNKSMNFTQQQQYQQPPQNQIQHIDPQEFYSLQPTPYSSQQNFYNPQNKGSNSQSPYSQINQSQSQHSSQQQIQLHSQQQQPITTSQHLLLQHGSQHQLPQHSSQNQLPQHGSQHQVPQHVRNWSGYQQQSQNNHPNKHMVPSQSMQDVMGNEYPLFPAIESEKQNYKQKQNFYGQKKLTSSLINSPYNINPNKRKQFTLLRPKTPNSDMVQQNRSQTPNQRSGDANANNISFTTLKRPLLSAKQKQDQKYQELTNQFRPLSASLKMQKNQYNADLLFEEQQQQQQEWDQLYEATLPHNNNNLNDFNHGYDSLNQNYMQQQYQYPRPIQQIEDYEFLGSPIAKNTNFSQIGGATPNQYQQQNYFSPYQHNPLSHLYHPNQSQLSPIESEDQLTQQSQQRTTNNELKSVSMGQSNPISSTNGNMLNSQGLLQSKYIDSQKNNRHQPSNFQKNGSNNNNNKNQITQQEEIVDSPQSKKINGSGVNQKQRKIKTVNSQGSVHLNTNESQSEIDFKKLFPPNYIPIQYPKLVNLPEYHERNSHKPGYLFIGFEQNMHVLLLSFCLEIEGKTYKDSKEFCQHLVNLSEIMDMWKYDISKSELILTIQHIITQLQGQLYLNIREKEIVVSDSIKQIEVYSDIENQAVMDWVRSGRKNSKIERQKEISLDHLLLREKAMMLSLIKNQEDLFSNMNRQIIDGVEGYMNCFLHENKLKFMFNVYTPDEDSNKWNKFVYKHSVCLDRLIHLHGHINNSIVRHLIKSFEGLWELNFKQRNLYYAANQFYHIEQQVSKENTSYNIVTTIALQKKNESSSNLNIQTKEQRRPSIVQLAERLTKEMFSKLQITVNREIETIKIKEQQEKEEKIRRLKEEQIKQQQLLQQQQENERQKRQEQKKLKGKQYGNDNIDGIPTDEEEYDSQNSKANLTPQQLYKIEQERQKKELELIQKKQNHAATSIQSHFKHKKNQKKRIERIEKEKNMAALKIQSRFKGKKQHKEFQNIKKEKKKAIQVIEKQMKKNIDRKRRKQRFRAAFKIQKMFKKFKLRQQIKAALREATKTKYTIHVSHTKLIDNLYVLYTIIEYIPADLQQKPVSQGEITDEYQTDFEPESRSNVDDGVANNNKNSSQNTTFFAQFQCVSNIERYKRLNHRIQLKKELALEIVQHSDHWSFFDVLPIERKVLFRRQILKQQRGEKDSSIYFTISRDNNTETYYGQVEDRQNRIIAQVIIKALDARKLNKYPSLEKYDLKDLYYAKVANMEKLRLNKKIRLKYELDMEYATNEKIWENHSDEEMNKNGNEEIQEEDEYNEFDDVQQELDSKKIKQKYWIKISKDQQNGKIFAFICYLPFLVSNQNKKCVQFSNQNTQNSNVNMNLEETPISMNGSNLQKKQNVDDEPDIVLRTATQEDKENKDGKQDFYKGSEHKWKKRIEISDLLLDSMKQNSTFNQKKSRIFEVEDYQSNKKFTQARVQSVQREGWQAILDIQASLESKIQSSYKSGNFIPQNFFYIDEMSNYFAIKIQMESENASHNQSQQNLNEQNESSPSKNISESNVVHYEEQSPYVDRQKIDEIIIPISNCTVDVFYLKQIKKLLFESEAYDPVEWSIPQSFYAQLKKKKITNTSQNSPNKFNTIGQSGQISFMDSKGTVDMSLELKSYIANKLEIFEDDKFQLIVKEKAKKVQKHAGPQKSSFQNNISSINNSIENSPAKQQGMSTLPKKQDIASSAINNKPNIFQNNNNSNGTNKISILKDKKVQNQEQVRESQTQQIPVIEEVDHSHLEYSKEINPNESNNQIEDQKIQNDDIEAKIEQQKEQKQNEFSIPLKIINEETHYMQVKGNALLQQVQNNVKISIVTNNYPENKRQEQIIKNTNIQTIIDNQDLYINKHLKFELSRGLYLEISYLMDQNQKQETEEYQQLQSSQIFVTELRKENGLIQVIVDKEDWSLLFQVKAEQQDQSDKCKNLQIDKNDYLSQEQQSIIFQNKEQINEQQIIREAKTYVEKIKRRTFILPLFQQKNNENENNYENQVLQYSQIQEEKANVIKKYLNQEIIEKEVSIKLQNQYQINEKSKCINLDIFLIKSGFKGEIRIVQEGELVDSLKIGKITKEIKKLNWYINFEAVISSYIEINQNSGFAQIQDCDDFLSQCPSIYFNQVSKTS